MRTFAIVLIVIGILMLIIPGVTFKKKEKVVDVGPVEINKKENKTVSWPFYAGAVVTVAGVVLLLASKRRQIG
ncbi:MAG TPA: hypothetical protein VKA49_20420 [Flavitalea sp.]|nr:hypothetical protein [Flavitalea sp.]